MMLLDPNISYIWLGDTKYDNYSAADLDLICILFNNPQIIVEVINVYVYEKFHFL